MNGVGKYIRSGIFAVGGHEWRIRYYPSGSEEDFKDYASVFLGHVGEHIKVRVVYDFRLADPATGLSSSVFSSPMVYDSAHPSWGTNMFKKRSELEASYLKDDCLVIQCDVTVIKESQVGDRDCYQGSCAALRPVR
uniref:MATH domain-containing protein n=1 Tax=Arundo donax TaxID=35708 RepID=A0A0A8YN87_ARUDO